MKKNKLNNDERTLLLLCLEKYRPDLIQKFEQVEAGLVDIDAVNEMRDFAVGVELANQGFKPDWEINDYGLRLEALIDALADLYIWPYE